MLGEKVVLHFQTAGKHAEEPHAEISYSTEIDLHRFAKVLEIGPLVGSVKRQPGDDIGIVEWQVQADIEAVFQIRAPPRVMCRTQR